MRKIWTHYTNGAAGFTLLMAAACSPGGAKPAGESDFSCAALIYAAHNLVEDKKVTDADGSIKKNYLSKMTGYATAYATSEGMEGATAGVEALGLIKLEAYHLIGTVSSSKRIPADQIVGRAKRCIAP
jgi:hypothetical protein